MSQVLSEDSSVELGRIYKQWRGLCAEAFTDTDNFGLSFPLNMEVRQKALLLGALFLVVSIVLFLVSFAIKLPSYTLLL